jgi:uncharacterized protein YukE
MKQTAEYYNQLYAPLSKELKNLHRILYKTTDRKQKKQAKTLIAKIHEQIEPLMQQWQADGYVLALFSDTVVQQ